MVMTIIKAILRWFIQSPVFGVIIGFFLSVLIIAIVTEIMQFLFVFIKNGIFRICLCIGACIISASYCYKYSGRGYFLILLVAVLAVILNRKEKKIISKADNVKFSISGEFRDNSVHIWGLLFVLSLFGPVLLCLNIIVCNYFETDIVGWFKFYWMFEEGFFKYNIIRYTIAFIPWTILIALIGLLEEMKTDNKKLFVDLEKVRKEEQNEHERILQMNPDAEIRTLGEKINSDENETHSNQIEDKSDDILKDISKFI